MERYFTNTKDVEFTDRLCEATLKTIIDNVPRALKNPADYAARAEIMWAGTIAHNNLLSTGRVGDWGSHAIEHELSAIYDIAHGAGLAIVFPAWMKYVYKHDIKRFAQFAHRVWNVEYNVFNIEETALKGISALESYYASIGLPVRLSQANIDEAHLEEMADKCTGSGTYTVGNFMKLDREDVFNIYKLAL
jgi:alcohol dehydrogenase YqhD (iron-dependent ADH family)